MGDMTNVFCLEDQWPFRDEPDTEFDKSAFEKVRSFLEMIGIKIVFDEMANGFFEHIKIAGSTIYVSEANLCNTVVRDIIHEAGHIATVPSKFRQFIDNNVDISLATHFKKWFDENADLCSAWPENKTFRAMMQCDDTTAIAWSYALCRHLELNVCRFFVWDQESFEVSRNDTIMRFHPGSKSLMHSGMAARADNLANLFPKMSKWVQD